MITSYDLLLSVFTFSPMGKRKMLTPVKGMAAKLSAIPSLSRGGLGWGWGCIIM